MSTSSHLQDTHVYFITPTRYTCLLHHTYKIHMSTSSHLQDTHVYFITPTRYTCLLHHTYKIHMSTLSHLQDTHVYFITPTRYTCLLHHTYKIHMSTSSHLQNTHVYFITPRFHDSWKRPEISSNLTSRLNKNSLIHTHVKNSKQKTLKLVTVCCITKHNNIRKMHLRKKQITV